MTVKEPRAEEFDGSEDLEGIALSHAGYQRLTAYSGPGLVKCRVLPEAGFVLEEDGRSLVFGFFLMSGYR